MGKTKQMDIMKNFSLVVFLFCFLSCSSQRWHSKWVSQDRDGALSYNPDEKGGIIPDFSRVGYHEGENPPYIETTIVLEPLPGDNREHIQSAIDKLAGLELGSNGFRGCLLLKNGVYKVSDALEISASGIVIRGEGNGEDGTVLSASGRKRYNLFNFRGTGSVIELANARQKIAMDFVPVGTKRIIVENGDALNVGDEIMVFRPGTTNWISDIKMDQIKPRKDGRAISQWEAEDYDLHFERKIHTIKGDTLYMDNPVVMEMEDKYGGGYVYPYSFKGRINHCGIENLLLKSEYEDDTDEDHAWVGVRFEKARDSWMRDLVVKHFGSGAVTIAKTARNISVLNSKCLDAKSTLNGGRRYSFNCNGQLNLFKNCETTEARHGYITGSKVCGPNVFTQSRAKKSHNDVGPHQRWTVGILYDLIESDGAINVQDRGNRGSGQGWSGANHVVWNCKAGKICVQNPWVSAKNFAIGCMGEKMEGEYTNERPTGEWEGLNEPGLLPVSLYEAQLEDRKK